MENRNEVTIFAETNFRNQRRRFGIKKDDRRRHMYIIGKTGVGKTTLLENMVISDIVNGNGVGVVDPHGEFAEKILDFVPRERVEDVIYIDPSDVHHPVAFNPIEKVEAGQRHLVASGLMGVFKKIWPDVWSARMEYILNNTILALLESPGSTLLGVMGMFSDKNYRKKVLKHVKDPVILSFWKDEFARYQQRYEVEATAAIQNKIGQFLSAGIVRNIVGQKNSTFDMRRAMDEKKIIIMNLSKGKVGEDNSKLLGGLLVAKLQLAAMSRVNMSEEERNDFYLYVDEFQNFATESFANILSEARKYRLNLILANQYIAQLTEAFEGGRNTTVRDAVFGNVGTLLNFRIGADDAEFLEKEFEPVFTINDLVNLPKFTVYLKLMIDGIVSRPFSARTLPPHPRPERSFKEEIIARSREKYTRTREDVEKEIIDWADIEDLDELPASSKPKKKNIETNKPSQSVFETAQGQKLYKASCMECGKEILVSFKPDGKKPILCRKDSYKLKEIKSGKEDRILPENLSLAEIMSKNKKKSKSTEKKPKKKNNHSTGGQRGKKPDVDFGKLRELLNETK